MKKILIACLISIGINVQAQNIDDFIKGDSEAALRDAEVLMENYMSPIFKGIGYGSNNGWYTTAKPHKTLGFDLTVTANVALIPDVDRYFTLDDSQLTNVQLSDPSKNQFPTILGPNLDVDEIPELTFLDENGDELVRISGPTGLGLEEVSPFVGVPLPMVQLGVGIIKETEIKLRFIPNQDFDGQGSFSLFGLGAMHRINQWIPVLKLSPFDISAFGGFTNIKTTLIPDTDLPNNITTFTVNSYTLQALASKKLAIFTPFVGVGYSVASTSLKMEGTYDLTDGTIIENPIDFKFNTSGPRANVGLRIKILILTIHGEYTIQKYNTLTGGIGLSIR